MHQSIFVQLKKQKQKNGERRGDVWLLVCLFQDGPRVLGWGLVSVPAPAFAFAPKRRDERQSRSSCCRRFFFCARKKKKRWHPSVAGCVWNSSWLFDAFLDFVCLNIPPFDRLLTPILILIVPSTFCHESKKIK